MSPDYAKKTPSAKKRNRTPTVRPTVGFWGNPLPRFLLGMGAVAGVLGLAIWLGDPTGALIQRITSPFTAWLKPPSPASDPAVSNPPAAAPAAAPLPINPRFEFYTLLPEMEISVQRPALPSPGSPTPNPVTSATPSSPKNPSLAPTSAGSKGVFVLQLAAFKKQTDAERLKADVALRMGLEMEIQRFPMANGEVWYRVRSRPYPTKQQAEQDRERLLAQQIRSLLIHNPPASELAR